MTVPLTAGDYATGLYTAAQAFGEVLERFTAKFGDDPCAANIPDDFHHLWHEMLSHEAWCNVQLRMLEATMKPDDALVPNALIATGLTMVDHLLMHANQLLPPTVN